MTTAAYPSGTNTYIPNVADSEARGVLIADFARKPEEFAVNEYCQIIPTKKQEGRFIQMTVEQSARVVNLGQQDDQFPDGADAPGGDDQLESFVFANYWTQRRMPARFKIGNITRDACDWNIIAQNARYAVQRAMTKRTIRVLNVATNTNNYAATHTADVTTIAGATGRWDQSTTARTDIKRTLDYAASIIRQDTNGAVKQSQLMVVISVECARKLAITQEVVNALIQSPDALRYLQGKLAPSEKPYGFVDLYGYKFVIEDAYYVASRKGASTTLRSPVLASSTPFMCARIGGLEGVEGAPNFSTFCNFMNTEMLIETFDDAWNKRTLGRIIEDDAPTMVAPVSGYLFTNATS